MLIVPGNHDIYTGGCPGRALFQQHMAQPCGPTFLRPHPQVGILGLNSALPRPPFMSSGALTPLDPHVRAFQEHLADPALKIRVAVLHHPPLPRSGALHNLHPQHRQLVASLCDRWQVDLLLNGHTHRPFQGRLHNRCGTPSYDTGSSTQFSPQQPTCSARYSWYDFCPQGVDELCVCVFFFWTSPEYFPRDSPPVTCFCVYVCMHGCVCVCMCVYAGGWLHASPSEGRMVAACHRVFQWDDSNSFRSEEIPVLRPLEHGQGATVTSWS
mgnify:CR=1 FL=1